MILKRCRWIELKMSFLEKSIESYTQHTPCHTHTHTSQSILDLLLRFNEISKILYCLWKIYFGWANNMAMLINLKLFFHTYKHHSHPFPDKWEVNTDAGRRYDSVIHMPICIGYDMLVIHLLSYICCCKKQKMRHPKI